VQVVHVVNASASGFRTLAFLWKRKKLKTWASLAPSPLSFVHEVDAKRFYGGVLGSDVQWMVGMSGGVDV
jgi:hypothetical protein